MFKSVIAAIAAAPLFATAAVAGPYVNIEANSAFLGNDYNATLLETHVGYEDSLGESAAWYIQGGPAFEFEDGAEEKATELSGKVGLGVDVTESVNVYGEVWAMTGGEIDFDEDLMVGIKSGVKIKL